jgi:hypothetical protein
MNLKHIGNLEIRVRTWSTLETWKLEHELGAH